MFLPDPGAHVSSIDALRATDPQWVWQAAAPESLSVDGHTVLLVSLSKPGDAAALAVLRAESDGFTVLGTYAVVHGGLGAEFTIARRCRAPSGATALAIRIERTSRGYWRLPGEGHCPREELPDHPTEAQVQRNNDLCRIPAQPDVSWAAVAFDATRMWLLHGESDGAPPRNALRGAVPRCAGP